MLRMLLSRLRFWWIGRKHRQSILRGLEPLRIDSKGRYRVVAGYTRISAAESILADSEGTFDPESTDSWHPADLPIVSVEVDPSRNIRMSDVDEMVKDMLRDGRY